MGEEAEDQKTGHMTLSSTILKHQENCLDILLMVFHKAVDFILNTNGWGACHTTVKSYTSSGPMHLDENKVRRKRLLRDRGRQ